MTAFVDDRQLTPYTLMEKFAQQFNEAGFPLHEFDKALIRYKEAIHKLQGERETAQDVAWREVVDLAGTITAGIVPVVGESLHKTFNVATELYVKEHRSRQQFKDAMLLEDSISDLTRAFVDGLNQLAEEQITLSFDRTKHMRRVLLFFDTFERLAAEIAPWLLDYLLLANISSNVVLLVAGRDSIEHSTPDDPKQWLPFRDGDNIHFINLDSFTWDETRTYLATRGINDPTYVDTIWQQSRGLPLYLSLLTFNPQGQVDPTADVVANFLCWIPEQEQTKRRLALDAALFSRPFNQDDLAAFTYVLEEEQNALYHWLIRLPFIQTHRRNGRYLYHDLAQELFRRHLYQSSQTEYWGSSMSGSGNHAKELWRFQLLKPCMEM